MELFWCNNFVFRFRKRNWVKYLLNKATVPIFQEPFVSADVDGNILSLCYDPSRLRSKALNIAVEVKVASVILLKPRLSFASQSNLKILGYTSGLMFRHIVF